MSQHGSLINQLTANSPSTKAPVVGDGATEIMWSDRRPYTIIAVSRSGKKITVQADKSTRTDDNGMSECQTYLFERNPDGYVETVKLQKRKGVQKWVGEESGATYRIGIRSAYHDYSF